MTDRQVSNTNYTPKTGYDHHLPLTRLTIAVAVGKSILQPHTFFIIFFIFGQFVYVMGDPSVIINVTVPLRFVAC